jgi:hypothetical protein
MPQADGDSPMGHGTLRIVFRNLLKLLGCFFVPEQCNSATPRSNGFCKAAHGTGKCTVPSFRCHFFVMMTFISQP